MYINVQSDNILRHLRKPGEKGYHMPKGKENVSVPHSAGHNLQCPLFTEY